MPVTPFSFLKLVRVRRSFTMVGAGMTAIFARPQVLRQNPADRASRCTISPLSQPLGSKILKMLVPRHGRLQRRASHRRGGTARSLAPLSSPVTPFLCHTTAFHRAMSLVGARPLV